MYLKNNYSIATDTSNPLRATCFNCHYGPKPGKCAFPFRAGHSCCFDTYFGILVSKWMYILTFRSKMDVGLKLDV